MLKKITLILSITVLIPIVGCTVFILYIFIEEEINGNCTKKLGYTIQPSHFENVKVKGESYFTTVELAIDGDSAALRNLSAKRLGDGTLIEHSMIMVDIIKHVGEKYYAHVIEDATYEELVVIEETLYTGCEFSNQSSIEATFPKLAKQFPILGHSYKKVAD